MNKPFSINLPGKAGLKVMAIAGVLLSFMMSLSSPSQAQKKGEQLFKVPLGVQAYTFRNHWKNGVEQTLDTIQALGFVELEATVPAGITATEFRDQCERRGIRIPSMGASFEELEADPQEVADRAKLLGARYVMCAWIPHQLGKFSEENANRAIQVFNAAGNVMKANGLIFKYHIHGYEFQAYKKSNFLNYLLAETDPDLVKLQMDVLWVHFGGGDPVKLLKKHGDRWVSLHLKDLRKGAKKDLTGITGPENDVALGEGELDFPSILKAANRIGIKHMFFEDESEHELEALPKSIAYLQGLRY